MLPLHARDSPASPAALTRRGGFFPRKGGYSGPCRAHCRSVAEPLHFRVRRLPTRDFWDRLHHHHPLPATPLRRAAQAPLSRQLDGCVSAQACLIRPKHSASFRRVFAGVQEPEATDLGSAGAMGSGCRIECIFFSEFHPTLGPKITYQVPSGLAGPGAERDALGSSSRLRGSGGFPCPVLHAGTPLLHSCRI